MPRLFLRQFGVSFVAFVLCVSAAAGAFASTASLGCASPAASMDSQSQDQNEGAANDQGTPCNFICLDCTNCVSCVTPVSTQAEAYVTMPDLADGKSWASLPQKASRRLKPAVPPPIAFL